MLSFTSHTSSETMTKRTRRTFSANFRLTRSIGVVKQGCSVIEVAKAMKVSKSAADKWCRQLKQDQKSVS